MSTTSRSTGSSRSGSRSASSKAKTTTLPPQDEVAATPKAAKPVPRKPAARKPQPTAAPVPAADLISPEQQRHMIAEAAYYLAERRGFGGDDCLADWFTAEAQIAALLGHSTASSH